MNKTEKVVKGLENCSQTDVIKPINCPGCPYEKSCYRKIKKQLLTDSLEVIKEQQAEIARLKGIITWIDPEKQPPTPNDSVFGRCYIVRNKHGDVFTLRYARREIRGKYVERWQRDDMSVYHGEIVAYMDMPK